MANVSRNSAFFLADINDETGPKHDETLMNYFPAILDGGSEQIPQILGEIERCRGLALGGEAPADGRRRFPAQRGLSAGDRGAGERATVRGTTPEKKEACDPQGARVGARAGSAATHSRPTRRSTRAATLELDMVCHIIVAYTVEFKPVSALEGQSAFRCIVTQPRLSDNRPNCRLLHFSATASG